MLSAPDVRGDRIVFTCEGDLWLGSISQGQAHRITTDEGVETRARFSPDGKWIAFSAQYDGARNDVYLLPTSGGAPKRLTYDPFGADMVGWTPDSKRVLFRSRREVPEKGNRLYTVPATGGLPTVLPMEKASQGSFSPDGSQIAFSRLALEEHHWKRYHGGEANAIWIADLGTQKFRRIGDDSINEQYPTWAGGSVYYVSEKDGSANLWRWDAATGRRKRITNHEGLDVRAPASDGKTVIYQFGSDLWTYDIATGTNKRLDLALPSDRIHARAHEVAGSVTNYSAGPTGKRILATSRGQLFSLPVGSGEVRPIASEIGSNTKGGVWSADGKQIAFISDRSGEENIWVVPTGGSDAKMLTNLSGMPIDGLQWSPDGKSLAFVDLAMHLWLLDVATKKLTDVEHSEYGPPNGFDFSHDSKWIAYSRPENYYVTSLYLYNIASGQATRLTQSPMRDSNPVFDQNGKYVYFASERNIAPKDDGVDFQMDLNDTTKLFLITLAKDTPSPLAPKIEDEGVAPVALPAAPASATADLKIDLDGIADRIVELPAAAGSYRRLSSLPGKLLYVAAKGDGSTTLKMFTAEGGKESTLAEGVGDYDVSGDGSKLVAHIGGGFQVVDAGTPFTAGQSMVDLSGWRVQVDPMKEWRETFLQGWRQERDVFYDPNHHGQDWDAVRRRYEAVLPAVGCRADLNEILGEMIGEMNVSHEFVGGGYDRISKQGGPAVASLGIDLQYDAANKGYRISKILRGDGFDLTARSPLLQPGFNVKVGDYVLAINGTNLSSDRDPNADLIGLAGQIATVKVNDKPGEAGSRVLRVRPMASDMLARYYDWTEWCRSYVSEKGGPNLGYVHLPDMQGQGIAELSKWLYANLDKDGLVIDVRYNHGGIVSGQVLERLTRVIFEFDQSRYGAPQPYHRFGYSGKLVVLCNEYTASDGEYFCTGFKMMKLGPVVGTRTWGGFMAVGGGATVDGGFVSTPEEGSFSPDGKWLPDGTGFTPDYPVDEDPNAFREGRDAQLDKALELLKAAIAKDPPMHPKRLVPPSREKAFPPNKKGGG